MKKFGGSMWDTLFLLVKDNDEQFIRNYIERLPCESCSKGFLEYMKKYDLNCSRSECYKKIWTIRCKIDKKYRSMNTEEDLSSYLKYLFD